MSIPEEHTNNVSPSSPACATRTARMRYAFVNGEKRLPEKGLHGTCPLCGAEVFAKCGVCRLHHWAHLHLRDCDSWSEGKTAWHIAWQDMYPKEWQEFTIQKATEKHRADVYIPDASNVPHNHCLTIEFQHSFLTLEELQKREHFYDNLVWVVDLSSKKRDIQKFNKNAQQFIRRIRPGWPIFFCHNVEKCLPFQ